MQTTTCGRWRRGLCAMVGVWMAASLAAAQPAGPALYGEPTRAPATAIEPYADDAGKPNWPSADLTILTTELSPAWIVRTPRAELDLFTDLPSWDLGGPSHLAYVGPGGPVVVPAGRAVAGDQLQANWLLVWFSGSKNWTRWDVPWLVVLQKRPTAVRLDEQGLHIQGGGPVERVCMLPLYGYLKCPPQGKDYLAAAGAPPAGVRTWEWAAGLPADVVERCTWWSRALREVPIECTETFSVDRARDSVTIRQRFQYLAIQDDWGTEPIRFAPLPPTLGVAHLAGGPLPLTFGGPVHDCDYFTSFGPYLGMVGTDTNEYTLGVLQYVNAMEAQPDPATLTGPAAEAAAKMRNWLDNRVGARDDYWPPWGLDNIVWSTSGADFVPAKYIRYASPDRRANLERGLDAWFQSWLLSADPIEREGKTYRFFFPQQVGNRLYYHTQGPGIGGDVYGDGGKLMNNALYTYWCYGHFMDRWDAIAPRWEMLQRVFVTPLSMSWKGVGRDAIAELGDVGQPVLAYARMAYRLGDIDSYHYGCYVFAKMMVQHYVNERGGEYFWRHQPMNREGVMPRRVYLTNLWGHVYGWDLGGPGFGSTQWTNRYVRFNDEDIARFHRDMLGDLAGEELDHWIEWTRAAAGSGHEAPYELTEDRSHINPSLVRLRSFLQNLPPERLAGIAPVSAIQGNDTGSMMSWYAYVRGGQTQTVRLIPATGEPSPFVLGRQRDAGGSNPFLAAFLRTTSRWPVPAWYGGMSWQKGIGWRAPKMNLAYRTGEDYPFGAIRPGMDQYPRNVRSARLNWNTAVYAWDATPRGPRNLALASGGATASVSERENDYYNPTRLVNGDYSDTWSSERDRKPEKWFAVDFGRPQAFDRISILFGQQSRTNLARIEVSDDGSAWRPLEVSYQTPDEINLPAPVQARAVRFVMGEGSHVSVHEVEIYAPQE